MLVASLNEEVQNLHHSMHPEIFKPFDKAAITEAVKVFIAADNCQAYIAWKGEEPVGYMILFVRETGDNAFHYNIRSVYIDQIGVPRRCQKLGIGKLLLERAELVARDNGIQRIELDHWSANIAAAAYFRKSGYVLCKERLCRILEL